MTTEVRVRPAEEVCCPLPKPHVHPDDSAELVKAAAAFKALSDDTRLRLLRAIGEMGELCECNMVPAFGLSQPTINYHLRILREAGLIDSERRGQWVYHRTKPKALLGIVRQLTEIA